MKDLTLERLEECLSIEVMDEITRRNNVELLRRMEQLMIKHHFTEPGTEIEACASNNQSKTYSLPSCENPLKTTCGNCKRTKIWKAAFIEYERAGETG